LVSVPEMLHALILPFPSSTNTSICRIERQQSIGIIVA
jgi:hypothetical protein